MKQATIGLFLLCVGIEGYAMVTVTLAAVDAVFITPIPSESMMTKPSATLVIGDCHAPCMLHGYPDFLLRIYEKYRCTKVVHIGDLVDLHCISYHERSVEATSAVELDDAAVQINTLTEYFPRVKLLLGNHDALIQRQATTAGLPQKLLRDFKSIFSLPRGWEVFPRYHKLVINDVLYQHGDQGKGGQFAALKNAHAEFMSVVQGHYHSQGGVWYHANESNIIFGMQVGCGIDRKHMQMDYGIKFSAKPIIGCGVVIDSQTAFFERMPLT
jgi:hypothetical protein